MRVRGMRMWMALGAAALTLTAAGCSNSEGDSGSAPTSVSQSVTVTKNASLHDQLPDRIKSSGQLIVGVNVPYSPNEFKDSSGKIVGFDVDVMNKIGTVLGVTPVYKEADFDKIIPAIQQGTFDVGMSSFTDTREREKTVDFVTYFSAGVQWAQPAGKNIDPNNACGLSVAVQSTTTEDTDELPAKSQACVDAGKKPINKVKFDDQASATNALMLGKVDAMSADSPVTAYAVKQSNGKLELAGDIFDSAPYGFPVQKGSPLGPVLQKAVQELIDSGAFAEVARSWGVENGVIKQSELNGAIS